MPTPNFRVKRILLSLALSLLLGTPEKWDPRPSWDPTRTLEKPENQDPCGTLEKPENWDPSRTLGKQENWEPRETLKDWKTGTRNPSRTLAGPYQKQETGHPTGTLEKPKN